MGFGRSARGLRRGETAVRIGCRATLTAGNCSFFAGQLSRLVGWSVNHSRGMLPGRTPHADRRSMRTNATRVLLSVDDPSREDRPVELDECAA